MASGEKCQQPEGTKDSDLFAVHELIHSTGSLKFALRSIESMHIQSALLSKVSEPIMPASLTPIESDKVLENIISEISSSKRVNGSKESNSNEADPSLLVEDLELIQNRLKDEYEKRRSNFIKAFSKKCNDNETFLKYL